MRSFSARITVSCISLVLSSAASAAPELKTDQEKTLYALGVLVDRSLQPFALSDAEFEIVKAGFFDSRGGKAAPVDVDALTPQVQNLQKNRVAVATAKTKADGAAYVAKVAAGKGVQKTLSGALVRITKEGTGEKPALTDTVRVNYEGRLINGVVFDSSYVRTEPAVFALTAVIRCWTEALQVIKVGSTAEIVCPWDIAYGERGMGAKIPPAATLIFKVELLGIAKEGAK